MIKYIVNDSVTPEDFIDILIRSGLSKRRPVDKKDLIKKMIGNANLIVTARNQKKQIVGIARCITDYAYCCYLSCLAVDKNYQKKGIGKKLIGKVLRSIGKESMLLLLSAPETEGYYLNTDFEIAPNAYIIKRGDKHKAALISLRIN